MEQKITVPQILDKKKYMRMKTHDQEEYVEKKIKEVLRANQDGVTIPDVVEATPFTRPTIIKHLEKLVACRDAYKIKRRRLTVYYSNGRIVHPEHQVIVETGSGGVFRGTFLDNNFGKFVYLEEINTQNISGGGMLISIKNFGAFEELLNRLDNKRRVIKDEEGTSN